jgi:2-polyprenyl-6-methoxyphenol hydroxylase-like FAD-dependent oxidoreductase
MGLEDAAALAALLPPGTASNSEDIPQRLELFEKIRKPRAEWLAELSANRVYRRRENQPTQYSGNETDAQIFGYDVIKVIKDAWDAEKTLNV